jgi:hypothetical protein
MFGSNLKATYDPNGADMATEQILLDIEAGKL